jgi:hypothetical protein
MVFDCCIVFPLAAYDAARCPAEKWRICHGLDLTAGHIPLLLHQYELNLLWYLDELWAIVATDVATVKADMNDTNCCTIGTLYALHDGAKWDIVIKL